IAGTQNDIAFTGDAAIQPSTDDPTIPDCTVNPAIKKEHSLFNFQPPGCSGTACTGVRALVFSLRNETPIPDGSAVYTCNVKVSAKANGTIPLTVTGVVLSTPTGGMVAGGAGCDGSITIGGPVPTPTKTPTPTPTVTATATNTPTRCVGACSVTGAV